MILYDGVIRELQPLLSGGIALEGRDWSDGGSNQMIFRQDSACELGGGNLPALGGTLITGEAVGDGMILLGPDISDLHGDVPYARIALVQVRKEAMGEGNALYQAIRKTEYTRYHVAPEGFQPGISARTRRETARVGLQAQRKGLSFAHVGRMFQEGYQKLPWVESVRMVFITDPNFNYAKLEEMLNKAENITTALDHLLQKVKMDCNACHLKDICAEVEELCASDRAQIANTLDERL